MGNCLKTQLKESVDNIFLPVFGSLMLTGVSPDASTWRKIRIVYRQGVSGTATITSENGNVGFIDGSTVYYTASGNRIQEFISTVAGEKFVIQVSNKDDISELVLSGIDVDLSQMKFNTTKLHTLNIQTGNISNINTLDFSEINNITLKPDVSAQPFNLSDLAGTTGLVEFETYSRQDARIEGDIANFAGNTNLNYLAFDGKNQYANIYGDIASLASTKITTLNFPIAGTLGIYGDLSTTPSTLHAFEYDNQTQIMTWKGTKTGKRLSLRLLVLAGEDLDRMLNNQANLEAYTDSVANNNVINITTSPFTAPTVASSVFNAIKAKGITTININGVDY